MMLVVLVVVAYFLTPWVLFMVECVHLIKSFWDRGRYPTQDQINEVEKNLRARLGDDEKMSVGLILSLPLRGLAWPLLISNMYRTFDLWYEEMDKVTNPWSIH